MPTFTYEDTNPRGQANGYCYQCEEHMGVSLSNIPEPGDLKVPQARVSSGEWSPDQLRWGRVSTHSMNEVQSPLPLARDTLKLPPCLQAYTSRMELSLSLGVPEDSRLFPLCSGFNSDLWPSTKKARSPSLSHSASQNGVTLLWAPQTPCLDCSSPDKATMNHSLSRTCTFCSSRSE